MIAGRWMPVAFPASFCPQCLALPSHRSTLFPSGLKPGFDLRPFPVKSHAPAAKCCDPPVFRPLGFTCSAGGFVIHMETNHGIPSEFHLTSQASQALHWTQVDEDLFRLLVALQQLSSDSCERYVCCRPLSLPTSLPPHTAGSVRDIATQTGLFSAPLRSLQCQ